MEKKKRKRNHLPRETGSRQSDFPKLSPFEEQEWTRYLLQAKKERPIRWCRACGTVLPASRHLYCLTCFLPEEDPGESLYMDLTGPGRPAE